MQPTPCRLGGLLGLFLLGGALVGCQGSEPPAARDPAAPQPDPTPQLIYENITLTAAKPDGGILWRIQAERAEYEPAQPHQEQELVQLGSAHLSSLKGELFDGDNRAIRTRADQGSIYPDERRLELRGQVQVESEQDQLRLQAHQVEWLPSERLLRASGQVYIELLDQQGSLQGEQLVIDFAQEQMELTGPSPGQPIRLDYRDPSLQLLAQRLVWQMDSGKVQALGAVEIQAPTQALHLKGEQLFTQVPLREQTELRLVGNVTGHAAQTGQTIAAQEIRWRIGSSRLQALGSVRYRQPRQMVTVSGNEALLDWQANTAQVRGNSQTQLILP